MNLRSGTWSHSLLFLSSATTWENRLDAVRRPEGTEALRRIVHQREVHLRDLVGVVSRHWRLVALLTVLVAGGAWYSARRQVPRYQSRLTVQVSSPKQVFAQLEGMRVDELALQTDPVLSEALILTTQQLALEVVRGLALHLELDDPGLRRGDLFAAVAVDSTTPPGAYRLTVQPTSGFEVRDGFGTVVAQGQPGETVVGPGFTLRLVPSPEARTVGFRLVRPEEAGGGAGGRARGSGDRRAEADLRGRAAGQGGFVLPHQAGRAAALQGGRADHRPERRGAVGGAIHPGAGAAAPANHGANRHPAGGAGAAGGLNRRENLETPRGGAGHRSEHRARLPDPKPAHAVRSAAHLDGRRPGAARAQSASGRAQRAHSPGVPGPAGRRERRAREPGVPY